MSTTQAAAAKQNRAAIVDEYGPKDRARQELKARLKLVDADCKALEAKIAGWHANSPAEQGAVEEGERYIVQVSACENQTKIIDIRKVAKAMGAQAFYSACKISLETLKKTVIAERYKALVRTAQTGPRTITAVPKAPPAIELPKAA